MDECVLCGLVTDRLDEHLADAHNLTPDDYDALRRGALGIDGYRPTRAGLYIPDEADRPGHYL